MAAREMSALQIAQAQLNQANAQVRLATERLRRSSITAPYDGVIVSGDLSQQIAPVEMAKKLFEIAPLESYREQVWYVFGALLWLAVVLPAALLGARHGGEQTNNLADQVLSTSNLWVMAAVFPVVKLLHELGHGFAARAWGGRVSEMGVMLLVFAPARVDAEQHAAGEPGPAACRTPESALRLADEKRAP